MKFFENSNEISMKLYIFRFSRNLSWEEKPKVPTNRHRLFLFSATSDERNEVFASSHKSRFLERILTMNLCCAHNYTGVDLNCDHFAEQGLSNFNRSLALP